MFASTAVRRLVGAAPRTSKVWAPRAAFHASVPSLDKEPAAAPGPLADIRVQLPLGFLAAIPALQTQVFVLSEETQLLGCFMVFVGTVYSQAGDAIGKMLDAKGETIIAEHNAQEEVVIKAMRSVIESHEKKLSLVNDMQTVYGTQAELLNMLASAKSMELQYAVREDIVKKLDYLVQREEMSRATRQTRLVEAAAAAVTDSFASKAELQAKALDEALATIAGSKKAGSDVIGDMFVQYFKTYVDGVKASNKEEEIPAEILELANAEVLALRKRSGNEDEDLSGFPTKYSLSS